MGAYKGKYVWPADGDYRVSQVFEEGLVILTGQSPTLPTISIITKLEALESQRWSVISSYPIKLIGARNYETVLGAQKQTILFEQL